jgi:hypothetical protein
MPPRAGRLDGGNYTLGGSQASVKAIPAPTVYQAGCHPLVVTTRRELGLGSRRNYPRLKRVALPGTARSRRAGYLRLRDLSDLSHTTRTKLRCAWFDQISRSYGRLPRNSTSADLASNPLPRPPRSAGNGSRSSPAETHRTGTPAGPSNARWLARLLRLEGHGRGEEAAGQARDERPPVYHSIT